jgi:glutathione S-transferase
VLRLLTLPISHYCEKARWALERAGMPYREERHVQGIHQRAALRAGGSKTVPVLVCEDRVIGESAEILDWVDERIPPEHRLFPSDPAARGEVQSLCERLDEVLGPRGRRLMYVRMFVDPKLALRFNNHGVPYWEDRAIRMGWPMFRRLVERELGIRPGLEVTDEAAVFAEFDFVAESLSDGRPYLCGESFSAADLTFACLASALVVPPQYGVPLPQPELLPTGMKALVSRAREHPAGSYALAMFAEHRRVRIT